MTAARGSFCFHPGFLHVTLLEAIHSDILRTARSLRECIAERALTRCAPGQIPWVPEFKPRNAGHHPTHFSPRIYTTWGTFDIGAVYLSPDTRVHTHSDSLSAAGQNLDVAFMPIKPDEWSGADFNDEFIKSYEAIDRGNPDEPQPAGFRFFCSLRLKLSPGAVWPSSSHIIDEAQVRYSRVLKAAWEAVSSWVGHEVPEDTGGRHAALGLCVGWNEMLVVAHASNPSSLLDLVLDVRGARVLVPSPTATGEATLAFETSFSTFGCDVAAFRMAQDFATDMRRETGNPVFGAADVVEISRRVASGLGELGPVESHGTYLRPSFHVYPGYENALIAALEEALGVLPAFQGEGETTGRCTLEVGKQDILSPRLHFSQFQGPLAAVAYVSALIDWLEQLSGRAGDGVGSARPPRFFDTSTRFGRDGARSHAKQEVVDSPARFEIQALAPHVSEIFRNPICGIKDDLRTLQVPYETTDRLTIMANVIAWAWQRQVPSDESIELVPAFLCLRAALQDAREWWGGRSLQPTRRPARYRTHHPQVSPADETFRLVQDRLERLNQELRTLLDGIRWSFSARQLTSYVLGDFADLNLRFRGSFHQLLSVANLLVDALVSQLIGCRASIASIGIASAPEMTTALDVVLIDLPVNALGNPLLLESIGHEVGHQLLRDLIAEVDSDGWPRHRWKRWVGAEQRFDNLVALIQELDAEVFLGTLAREESFLESTSDLIERMVLGYPTFEDWVKSFTLRAVLASTAIQQDQVEDRRGAVCGMDAEVPQIPSHSMVVIVERVILVAVAEELAEWNPKSETFPEFRKRLMTKKLEELREFLLCHCVLGPTRDVYTFLKDEKEWKKFLSAYVFDLPAPWLADDEAAELAGGFFRALVDLAHRPQEAGELSAAHFLREIREALGDLRATVLSMATPSLHVRHNLDASTVTARKDRGARGVNSKWADFPWHAVRQPLDLQVHADSGEDLPADHYQMVIGQRGSMLPLSLAAEGEFTAAVARFYWKMITLVAAWRRGTVEIMDRIETPGD